MRKHLLLALAAILLISAASLHCFSAEKKFASSYIGAGVLNFDQGNYIEAILNLKSAEQLSPDPVEVYKYLGLAYSKMSLWPQAAQVFCKILIQNPADPERDKILKSIHLWESEKEYVPAMAQYSFYSIKYKNKIFAEPDNLLNYLSLTEIYKCAGRYGEAESFFRALLKDKPNNVTFRENLAEVLYLDKKYAEAGKLFREILDVQPYNTDAMLGLDLVLKQRYESMINSDPNNMGNHIKLARVLRDMKRYEDAIEEYNIFLQSDSANADVTRERDETQTMLDSIARSSSTGQ